MYITALETEGPGSSAVEFFRSSFGCRPEFKILEESETLREAMKEALDSDLAIRKETVDKPWYKLFFMASRRTMKKLMAIREEKFEQYEMIRRLVATDNRAIILKRTRWITR
jgi:hypothetical protein